jgi:hypothetical protein
VDESKLKELKEKLYAAMVRETSSSSTIAVQSDMNIHFVKPSLLFDAVVEIAREIAKEEVEAFRLRLIKAAQEVQFTEPTKDSS